MVSMMGGGRGGGRGRETAHSIVVEEIRKKQPQGV